MAQNTKKSTGKISSKREDLEIIKTLNHRLNNILGFSESSMNRLKNADVNTVEKRWFTMKDVFVVTGRDRINKEIRLYRRRKEIIEKVSGEIYTYVCSRFLEVDKCYKIMFDLLENSVKYSRKDKDASITSGDEMVRFLKDIINKLEAVKIGLQKT